MNNRRIVEFYQSLLSIRTNHKLREYFVFFIKEFLNLKSIYVYNYNEYLNKFVLDTESAQQKNISFNESERFLNADEIKFVFNKLYENIVQLDNDLFIIIKDNLGIIELIKFTSTENISDNKFKFIQEITNYYEKRFLELNKIFKLEKDVEKAKTVRKLTNNLFSEIDITKIIVKSFKVLNEKYFVKNMILTLLNKRNSYIYYVNDCDDKSKCLLEIKNYLKLREQKLGRQKTKEIPFEDTISYSKIEYQLIHFDIDMQGEFKGVITLNIPKHHLSFNSMATLKTIINLLKASLIRFDMYNSIRENYLKTIKALAIAVDAKDSYTHTHSENVMKYAELIANRLGLKDNEVEMIKNGALLHDIGKIGIPGFILNKPDNLTKEEFEQIIQQHVIIGANIIKDVPFLEEISKLVLYHHEYYNGNGYPEGLKGDSIPLGARIVAVADVFDALTTNRPYRAALKYEEAIKILKEKRNTHLDKKIVDVFLEIIQEKNFS